MLRWARSHHQLVTRAAWIAGGQTDRSFDRAMRQGVLHRMGHNVGLMVGADPLDPVVRIAAAVLATGRPAIVSHRSAAFLWGAPVEGVDPVELTVTDRQSATRAPGVVVHRPRDVDGLRPVSRRRLSTTPAPRTLIDLGASAPGAVTPALEAFLVAGTVTVRGVRAALAGHRRPGRAGVGALHAALADLALGAKPPDSVLESAMARVFARGDLLGWVFHPRVAGYELDFAFPARRLAVEVDGWASHGGRAAFEADRARDAHLASLGWVVLRFTWRQVTQQPGAVAATVRRALAMRPG